MFLLCVIAQKLTYVKLFFCYFYIKKMLVKGQNFVRQNFVI